MTRFALAAAIGPWLMFEIVQTKLPHYLLPTFPALAFLMADAIVRCLRGERDDLTTKGTRAAMCIWGAIVIAICVAPWGMPITFDPPLIKAMIAFTIVGAIDVSIVVVAFLSRRPRLALIAMGVGMLPAIAVMWGMYLPNAQFIRLSGNLADILKQNGAGSRDTKPGDVQMIGYKEPAVAYHQGGTIREQGDNDFHTKTPPSDWPRYLVIRDDIWQRTPDAVKVQLDEVGGARGIAYAAGGKTWYVHVVRKK
jgi:4-amino-4-deoxy-L-arabinose transferase-like glycosyltransferase